MRNLERGESVLGKMADGSWRSQVGGGAQNALRQESLNRY